MVATGQRSALGTAGELLRCTQILNLWGGGGKESLVQTAHVQNVSTTIQISMLQYVQLILA